MSVKARNEIFTVLVLFLFYGEREEPSVLSTNNGFKSVSSA